MRFMSTFEKGFKFKDVAGEDKQKEYLLRKNPPQTRRNLEKNKQTNNNAGKSEVSHRYELIVTTGNVNRYSTLKPAFTCS